MADTFDHHGKHYMSDEHGQVKVIRVDYSSVFPVMVQSVNTYVRDCYTVDGRNQLHHTTPTLHNM